MKAKREQDGGELMVIKLFASNYARDLMMKARTKTQINKCQNENFRRVGGSLLIAINC